MSFENAFKKLENTLRGKEEKQDKFVIYLLLIEIFVVILIAEVLHSGLGVALGTMSMALVIVYIEIVKPWLHSPKIRIDFDNKRPFCLGTQPVYSNSEENKPQPTPKPNNLHYHIRLRITNVGKLMAKRVRGKLIEIIDEEKMKPVEQFDPVFLHWSSVEFVRSKRSSYINPINLSHEEYDYLEIVFTKQEEKGLVFICTTTFRRGCLKEFKMNQPDPTKEIAQIKSPIFKIVITGENVEPVTEKYRLVWDGKKYDGIKMQPY